MLMLRALAAGLVGLLTAGLLVNAAPASADYVSWGSAEASNQRLHRKCHRYAYTYRVNPPTDNWAAELFLVGPKGARLNSAYYVFNADPAAGKGGWRLCRPKTRPGRYTIRMKVSYIDGYDLHEGWVKPTRFRLTRR
jgi:hypothetical protein